MIIYEETHFSGAHSQKNYIFIMEQLQEVLTVYFMSSKKVSCNKYDHHRAIPYISSTQFIQMSYYVMIIVLFFAVHFLCKLHQNRSRAGVMS